MTEQIVLAVVVLVLVIPSLILFWMEVVRDEP
jgi:hypothetical protein